MVAYRRNFVPGGTFFFTVTLRDRSSRLLVERIHELRLAYEHVQRRRPFTTDAIVVLPDHLHCIWTLPNDDVDYPGRWRGVKSRFTMLCRRKGVSMSSNKRGAFDVWQRRYWEHTIRDDRDFDAHVNYIHFNPVKHEYVKNVRDWPHSSFHRFVRNGSLPMDWASEPEIKIEE
jgi:putative transposase